jgi:acyl CoA:acetate/3-ketoacid CoA transferase alpha subunit
MATAAAAMATAAAAMAAAEKVVEVVEVVEVVRLMGARSLTEGWAVARQKRARMQRRAVRSSRT